MKATRKQLEAKIAAQEKEIAELKQVRENLCAVSRDYHALVRALQQPVVVYAPPPWPGRYWSFMW